MSKRSQELVRRARQIGKIKYFQDHGTDLEDTEDFQGSDSEYSESSVSSKESSIPPGSIYKFSDEDTSPKMYTDLQNMNTTVSLNENEVEENMELNTDCMSGATKNTRTLKVKSRKNIKKYPEKKASCFYCEIETANFARHLFTHHQTENAVQNIMNTENIEENPNDNDDDPKELENDSNEKFVSGEDLSEGKISKPKRSKTRKLVPWTDQQKKLLRDYFKMKIKNKVTPKKPEIMKLKESHPDVFKNKDWLLTKEEENSSNVIALKEALSSMESLKQEVNRLKPLEEQMNNCQDDLECLRHTSEKERWNLTSQLAQKEEIIRHLEERISVLTHRTEADCQALGAQLSTDERVRSLIAERALLERRLEEAHIHLSEIKTTWSNKIAILETQVGRLSRQAGEEGVERRNAEKKILELELKLEESKIEKENLMKKLDKLTKERDNLVLELKQSSA
ncbi:hypothetical protein PGB90_006481 [Kerria lacca]